MGGRETAVLIHATPEKPAYSSASSLTIVDMINNSTDQDLAVGDLMAGYGEDKDGVEREVVSIVF